MPQWTTEQQQAISARGASVTVSAAAGSGKTAVLVERLLGILSDEEHPVRAERLAVVTYTTDAAAEIRKRLSFTMTERIHANPESTWLRRQQTMLQSAKISTIHSFCYAIMREHFQELDISAGFRTLEDSEASILHAEAADEALETLSRQARNDPECREIYQTLYDAFCTRDDSDLPNVLDLLRDNIEKKLFGETMPEESAAASESGVFRTLAADVIRAALSDITALLDRAGEILAQFGSDSQLANLSITANQAKDAVRAFEAEDYAQFCTCISQTLAGRADVRGKAHDEERLWVKALWNHAKDLWKERIMPWKIPLTFANEDLPRHAKVLRAADRLFAVYSEALTRRKRERDAVSFADAMRMTLSLLAKRNPDGTIEKTPLAETISEQFDYIMVDEFQDADDQQDLIFRMLSRGGTAQKAGSNLFVVGDSKQCIYRFRNANPANFSRMIGESARFSGGEITALPENTALLLNRNFRSSSEVIGLVNRIFSMLMTKQIGEIDYDSDQMLIQGADYAPADRSPELLLFEKPGRGESPEPDVVADRIFWHLHVNHTPVQEKDTVRPCRESDFLILTRTKNHMQRYVDALAARGIAAAPLPQSNYLEAPEILLMIDLLRAVDNPLLDVSVAAAMLSPMFGFSLDEMVQIRLTDRSRELYLAMRKLSEEAPEGFPAETAEKIRGFLAFLESMRLFSAMDTPEQLIRRIYDETDFLGMMMLTKEGSRKKANLRTLLTYASQFEQSRGGGLSAFLRYLDAVTAQHQKPDAGNPPAGTAEVVRIKTIHGSKGLEAPFVILAESDTPFSRQDDSKVIQYNAALGLGCRLIDQNAFAKGDTLPSMLITAQNNREMISEEMRLLYVALTRARENLILPVACSDSVRKRAEAIAAEQACEGGQTALLTASAKCMLDWLLMALIRNAGCADLRDALAVRIGPDGQTALPFRIINAEPEHAEPETDDLPDAPVPLSETEYLRRQCMWTYDSPLAGLTAKYGVSELAKTEDFAAALRKPSFAREQHGLSGAERGTAVHTFLQYADFEAAAADPAAEIARLLSRGRLSKRQAKAVASSSVSEFFASPLYQRIRSAKRIWREQKFTVRLSDLHLTGPLAELGKAYEGTDGMLIGIMDLVFAEEDGIVLVDYKTDRTDSDEALLEHYTEQIRLYAEALNLLMDLPVKECCLYSICLNRTVPVPLHHKPEH